MERDYDVVVVGSGAAGLSARFQQLILEQESLFASEQIVEDLPTGMGTFMPQEHRFRKGRDLQRQCR